MDILLRLICVYSFEASLAVLFRCNIDRLQTVAAYRYYADRHKAEHPAVMSLRLGIADKGVCLLFLK